MKYIPILLALLSGCATTTSTRVVTAVAPTDEGGLLVRQCKLVVGPTVSFGTLFSWGIDHPVEFEDCKTITVPAWEPDEEE